MQRYFKRRISALDSIFDFTAEFASAYQIQESVSLAVNLAVEELFTNIVKYTTDTGNDISIHIDVTDSDLVVKITDFDTERFDVTGEAKVDVSKALDERKVGGIGLHLARNVVDKIMYEYNDGVACITLVKHMADFNV